MFLIDSNSAPLVAVFWVLQDGAWQRVMVHKSPGIPATLLILLVVFLFRGTLPHSHSPRAIGSVVSAINHGKGHSAFAKERRIGEGCWWAQDPESEGREPHVLHHRISLDSRVLAQVSSTAVPRSIHPTPSSVPCIRCGRTMERRASRYGPFYGCTGYRSARRCYFTRPALIWQPPRPIAVRVKLVAEMEDPTSFRLYIPRSSLEPQSLLSPVLSRITSVEAMHSNPRSDGEAGTVYHIKDYKRVVRQAVSLGASVSGIPSRTLAFFTGPAFDASSGETAKVQGFWQGQILDDAGKDGANTTEILRRLPDVMRRALCHYQVEGIMYAIRRGGRCLIADDMGLGKTLQALALAAHYRAWPILVVVPASMRLVWAGECERWLPFLGPHDIHVIFGVSDKPGRDTPKVTITSYQMLHRLRSDMRKRPFGLMIVDESHTLRPSRVGTQEDAAHTQTVISLMDRIQKAILLSGTPSPTRPLDLHPQASALRPNVFAKDRVKFSDDYCKKRKTRLVQGGVCRRPHELHLLLTRSIMIRRLKTDVLSELPPKRRTLISVVIHPSNLHLISSNETETCETVDNPKTHTFIVKKGASRVGESGGELTPGRRVGESIKPGTDSGAGQAMSGEDDNDHGGEEEEEEEEEEGEEKEGEEEEGTILRSSSKGLVEEADQDSNAEEGRKAGEIAADVGSTDVIDDDEGENHQLRARTVYELVGKAKVGGAWEWLEMSLQGTKGKFAVFAHHCAVIRGISRRLQAAGVGFVVLDGSTPAKERHVRLNRFTQRQDVRIALVSVTAGGQGLDLSAASVGVFVELPPDVGWCRQAEDRLHRRGQQNPVFIYYLVAHALKVSTPEEARFVDYDRDRWSRLCTDLRCITGVTDGPSFATSLDVSNIPSVLSPKMDQAQTKVEAPTLSGSVISPNMDQAQTKMEAPTLSGGEVSGKPLVKQERVKFCSNDTEQDRNLSFVPDGYKEPSFRFQVSTYTSRIYVFPPLDAADNDVGGGTEPGSICSVSTEDVSVGNAPLSGRVLLQIKSFLAEWQTLTSYQRRRLKGKPLSIPVSQELASLPPATRTKSTARYAQLDDGLADPPKGSEWVCFNVSISIPSRGGVATCVYSERLQAVDAAGRRLCRWCTFPVSVDVGTPSDVESSLNGATRKQPCRDILALDLPSIDYHEMFCSGKCMREWSVRSGVGGIRREVEAEDGGMCEMCGIDCKAVCEMLRHIAKDKREQALSTVWPKLMGKRLARLIASPTEGNAWHADHVTPVFSGGGQCSTDNVRTLCVTCHADVTREQAAERAKARREAKRAAASIDNPGVESGEAVKGKVKRRKKSGTKAAKPAKKEGDGR